MLRKYVEGRGRQFHIAVKKATSLNRGHIRWYSIHYNSIPQGFKVGVDI